MLSCNSTPSNQLNAIQFFHPSLIVGKIYTGQYGKIYYFQFFCHIARPYYNYMIFYHSIAYYAMFSIAISWGIYWNSLCTASALAHPLLPLCQISLSNRLLPKASKPKVQGKHPEVQGSICWAFDQTSLWLQKIFITRSICKLPARFTLCANCVYRASLKLLSTADWCNAQATSSHKDRWIIYNQVSSGRFCFQLLAAQNE